MFKKNDYGYDYAGYAKKFGGVSSVFHKIWIWDLNQSFNLKWKEEFTYQRRF